MEFNKAEFVIGIRNRGNVITTDTIAGLDAYGKNYADAYSSVYLQSEEFENYKDDRGGKRGYEGAVKAEGLHFDFDGVTALEDVKGFIEGICKDEKLGVVIDDFKIWFTGSKGFHVFWLNVDGLEPNIDTPTKIGQVCARFGAFYDSWDSAVYDRTRLWRVPNSKHLKTGLYKIPLLASEVWGWTIEQIREKAKKQRTIKHAVKEMMDEYKRLH